MKESVKGMKGELGTREDEGQVKKKGRIQYKGITGEQGLSLGLTPELNKGEG